MSLAAYIAVQMFSRPKESAHTDTMIRAVRLMRETISVIGNHCDVTSIEIDEGIDPNRTGLIGPEFSGLVTTLGHLESKRTATNPDMAGLVVHLLHEAGVTEGDTIAVGCSASFPGLMVATLAAAKAMDVYPVVIISLGASSYGATRPDFHLLDIYRLLIDKSIFTIQPAAISLGGGRDVGEGFDTSLRERLKEQIASSRIPFIEEPDLKKNVAERMRIYTGDSQRRKISAFVNTGGSYPNLGTSSLVLHVKPGLVERASIPPERERGVLFEMIAWKVPSIHLLFIRGLVMKYGLPWDPVPLPEPGRAVFYHVQTRNHFSFWMIVILYFILLILIFVKMLD